METRIDVIKLFALIGFLLFFPHDAQASLVTESFTFDATNFIAAGSDVSPPPAPSHVFGSFTVDFDLTSSYSTATTGLTINSISQTFLAPVPSGFNYDPTISAGQLLVGGLPRGLTEVGTDITDFLIVIKNVRTAQPTLDYLSYTNQTTSSLYASTVGTVSASVPEPASNLVMGIAAASIIKIRTNRAVIMKMRRFCCPERQI